MLSGADSTKGIARVKTIDRMVAILGCFTVDKPGWSLADLTARLGVPKSSLHRHLLSLEHHGILRRDAGKLWRLGHRLFIWGTLVPKINTLQHIAEPRLKYLVATTNETSILTIYLNHEVICIDKVESSHSVRMTLTVGTRRMPHAGASSKILMAHLADEEIQSTIDDKGLPKLSANTITDAEKLKTELDGIRRNGYAFSYEETDKGAWGVATPIFDNNGEVLAGIGIAGPASRFSDALEERYVHLCRVASEEITMILRGESLAEMSTSR